MWIKLLVLDPIVKIRPIQIIYGARTVYIDEIERLALALGLSSLPIRDTGGNPPPANKDSSSSKVDRLAEIRQSAVTGATSKASAFLCKYHDFHTKPLTLESLVVILCISYV